MGARTRLLICFLASIVYYNTLDAGFVYDDSVAVVSNPDVLATRPLWDLWSHDFWGTSLGSPSSHGSYRPLCVLSYRLTHAVCGFKPACYHLVNVVLHGLASGLVHKAACEILNSRAASIAGLLFAVHPIHTEAVAGIVGRADLLSCIFFLLSLLTYIEHVKRRDFSNAGTTPYFKRRSKSVEPVQAKPLLPDWVYLGSSLVLAACSTLCKETGITVLLVSAFYDLLIHRQLNIFKSERGVRGSVATLACAGAVILGLRLHIMGLTPPVFATSDNPAARSPSLVTRGLTFAFLPALNAWLLACPRWLSFDWSMDSVPRIETLSDVRNAASVALYLGLAICVKKWSKSGEQNVAHTRACKTANNNNLVRCRCPIRLSKSQAALFSLALLVLPFLPASNMFFYVGFVIAERVLYLPSVGYCLLVGLGYSSLYRVLGVKFTKTLMGLLLLTYASRTYLRNYDWLDDEALYRSGINVNPPKAYGNLGSILNSQGRLEEAELAYRAALRYRPNMAEVHYNLGILLHSRERHEEAIRSYQLAVKFRPSLALAYLNLGTLLESLGRWEEAESVLLRCSKLRSDGVKDPRTHHNTRISAMVHLGRMYADRGDYHRAVRIYSEAVTSRPTSYQPQVLYNLMGEALGKLNRHEEAERWFKASLQAKPDHVPAYLTYGKLLAKNRTRLSEAEQWFKRAQKLAPSDPSVYIHFGQFLEEVGRHCEAALVFKKAVELAPDSYEGVEGAANALRRSGRKTEAESFYRMAVFLKPEDSSARSNLGAILHLNGKKEEAALEYHHALRLDPGDETTLANLNKLTTSQPHQVPSWTASPPSPSWSSQSQPPPSQVQPESASNPVLNNIRDQAT